MTEYTVFGAETPPSSAAVDDLPYNLGVEFFVTASNTYFKAGEFWQPSSDQSNASRILSLWEVIDASSGTKIWESSASGVPSPGWNRLTHISAPILTVNQRYILAVLHPAGRYPITSNYFSSGPGSSNIVNGPLTVVSAANAASAGQGQFIQTGSVAYPTAQAFSSNYWLRPIVSDVNPLAVGSVADMARSNMLAALGLTEPQLKSNVDLMRLVVAAGGLGLVTVSSRTAAGHYWQYLEDLRD